MLSGVLRHATTSFASLIAELKVCRNLQRGRSIHEAMVQTGDVHSVFVANTLIIMYSKCGSLIDASKVFEQVQARTEVTWNVFISGYVENGKCDLALEVFSRMPREGCEPSDRTFLAAVQACSSLAVHGDGNAQRGKALHLLSSCTGCDLNMYVQNGLMGMYAKLRSTQDARKVFKLRKDPDVYAWNVLLTGHVENGEYEGVLDLFLTMVREGCSPDARTFVACVKASAGAKLLTGRALHLLALRSGVMDMYVESALLDMYARYGSMESARSVFDNIKLLDVVSWTALIAGYVDNGEAETALLMFSRMHSEGCTPDSRAFTAALKCCADPAAIPDGNQRGKALHLLASSRGCDTDISVQNTLVDVFSKCGSLGAAQNIFDSMRSRDVVSWTVLIWGYVENGDSEAALRLFLRMNYEGCAPNGRALVASLQACANLAEQDDGAAKARLGERGKCIHLLASTSGYDDSIYVQNTLVDMYAKCRRMNDAHRVFDSISGPELISWNALILGYADNGEGFVVLELYARMQREGCESDARTLLAVLKTCTMLMAYDYGEAIHAEICSRGFASDVILASCLVDFYAKCGSLLQAKQVFDSLENRDLLTWTSLMGGYSRHGDTEGVFTVFDQIVDAGLRPDGVTFLCVLAACSHAGLVDRGKQYFESMRGNYGVQPSLDHYHCMVDILGRANKLDEAIALLRSMPWNPTAVTWMTLLGACQKWKNAQLGRLAFESSMSLEYHKAGAYVLMADSNRTSELREPA